MTNTVKRFSADPKDQVSGNALNGDLTLAHLADKHVLYQHMILIRRAKALGGLAGYVARTGAPTARHVDRMQASCYIFETTVV